MRLTIALINIVVLCVIFKPSAVADVYGYVDRDGYHFTNLPMDSRYKLWFREQRNVSPYYGAKHSEPHIQKASQKYGVEPNLIKAIIKVESNFNPYAVSPAGALGIMQLMPGTATQMGVFNVFDMEENIHGGTQYLRNLLRMFNGDLLLSLAAYNVGEKMVRKCRGVPPVEETQRFVRQVLQWFHVYKASTEKARRKKGLEETRI